MNYRTMALTAIGLIAFGTSAVSFAQTSPGPQTTPPPPPIPPATTTAPAPGPSDLPASTPTPSLDQTSPPPVPSPSPSESGRRGRRTANKPTPEPSPSDTPVPPQFTKLDGVWEVAFQPLNGARTIYSHLFLTTQGDTITGTWKQNPKTTVPVTGTFDGRLFKITGTNGNVTYTFSGYEENFSDMVGLFTDGDPKHAGLPFTAGHRAKDRSTTVIR